MVALLAGDVRERAQERHGLSPRNPGLGPLPQDDGFTCLYPGRAVTQAAFLIFSPWLPVTFSSCPSHTIHMHPFRGPLNCQTSPSGVPEQTPLDNWGQGGDVPSAYKTSIKHDFYEDHFSPPGAKEEILNLKAI